MDGDLDGGARTMSRAPSNPPRYDVALELIQLRKSGMSVSNMVVAMEHFRGERLSYEQVRYLMAKTGVPRGSKPFRALSHRERRAA